MKTEARMAIEKWLQKRDFFSSIIKQFISTFTLLTFIFSQSIFMPLYAQDGAQTAPDQTSQPQIQEISAEDAQAQQQASASGQIQSPSYQPPEEVTTQDFMTDDSALSAADEEEQLVVDSGELAEKKLAEAEGEVAEEEQTIMVLKASTPVAPPVIAATEEEKTALTRSVIATALNIGTDEKFEIKQIYSNDAISTNYQTGEQSMDFIYRVTKTDGSILYANVNGAQVAGGITRLSASERLDGKYFDRELQSMEIKTISLAPAPQPEPTPVETIETASDSTAITEADAEVTQKLTDFEKRLGELSELTLSDFQEAQNFLSTLDRESLVQKEAYDSLSELISRKIIVLDVAGTKVKVFPTGLVKIVDEELSNLPEGVEWLPGITEEDFIASGADDGSLESDLELVLYMVSHYGEYFVKDGEVNEDSFRQWLRGENLEQVSASIALDESTVSEPEVMESEPELKVPDESTNVIEPEVMDMPVAEPEAPDQSTVPEPEVMEEPPSTSELKVPDESTNVVEPEVMEEPLVDTADVDGQKEVQEMLSLLESDHNKQMAAIGSKYSERLKSLQDKFAGQSEISLEEYNDIESMIFSIREEYEAEKKNYFAGRDKISQYAASKSIPFLLNILPMENRRGITFANEEHRNIENGINSLLASKSVGIQLKEGSVLHVNPALISDLIYRTRKDFGVRFGVEGQKLGEVPGITAEDSSKAVGPSEDEWGTPNERQNHRVALNVVERLGASIATKDGLVNAYALRKALLGGKPFENVSIEEDAERNVRVVVKPNFGETRVAYIAGMEPAFMTMNAKDKKVKIGDKTFDISNRDNVVSALQAINDSIDSNPLDRSSSDGDWRMVIEKFQDFVKTNSPASEKAREVVAAFRASLSGGGASGIPAERPGSFSSADRSRERKESSLAERKANRVSLFELWQKQKRSKSRPAGARISGFDE